MSSCSAFRSCRSCSGASGCHWCGDVGTGGCYADSDWAISCIWSTSCEDLQKCYRTEPQFIGYGSRWVFVVNGAIAVGMVLLLTLLGMVVCGVFVKVSSSTRVVEDNRYFELSELNDETEADVDVDAEGDEQQDIHFEQDSSASREKWTYIPTVLTTHTPKAITLLKKYSISLCLLLSLITILIVILLVILSPHMPDFSVCNSELGK